MKGVLRAVLLGVALLTWALGGCTRERAAVGIAPAAAAPDQQATPGAPAAPPGTATISLVADKTSISTGDSFRVDINVGDVTDLYAADIRLQFDPAKLEVVDANPNVPGTQIEVGKFLDPSGGQGFVAQNSADNAAGRITYAVTLLSPARPVAGAGTLASVTFRAKESGAPTISFLNVLLTNQTNGTITVTPRPLGAAAAQATPGAGGAVATARPGPAVTAVPGVAATPAAPSALAPAQPAQASVSIQPASSSVAVGMTATVNVQVANVTNMYGADVRLSFDPALLEVQDADPSQAGVQVEPGSCFPAGSQTARNTADNTAGTIIYAASRVAPAPAVTGTCNVIAIRFRGKAGGTSPINYSRAPQLADTSGLPINAGTSNGSVTVTSGPGQATATPTRVPGPTAVPGPRPPSAPGPTCTHRVAPGETLSLIALRYGTTAAAIAAANGLANPNRILVGQALIIPNCQGPVVPAPPSGCFTYRVDPGDTLLAIARRYGTSVAAIGQANGIANPNLIRIGQRIIVCPGAGQPAPVPPPTAGRPYVVRPGDTLTSIALRFNTTSFALAQANGLANRNLIYVGQVLRVP